MRLLGGLMLAGLLTGCANAAPGPEPEGWPISVDEAYRRLAGSELPEMRQATQCGILIHLTPRGTPNESVTWSVTSSGREMFNFTVHLLPLPGGRVGTRISVSADERGGEAYSGNQRYMRPAINQPVRPAIEEQVAALLEGRPFDRRRMNATWNEGCQIQRTALQNNGRPFSIKDRPLPGAPRTQPAGTGGQWGSPGGSSW